MLRFSATGIVVLIALASLVFTCLSTTEAQGQSAQGQSALVQRAQLQRSTPQISRNQTAVTRPVPVQAPAIRTNPAAPSQGTAARPVASSSYRLPASSRCSYGEDPRCDSQNARNLENQMRRMDQQERARLGSDYCLFHESEPQCQSLGKREEQRSQRELQTFCHGDPRAPRCLGFQLSPEPAAKDELDPSRRKVPHDDFFGRLNAEAPEPDDELFPD